MMRRAWPIGVALALVTAAACTSDGGSDDPVMPSTEAAPADDTTSAVSDPATSTADEPAPGGDTTVYANGTVYTVAADGWAESFAVTDGEIVAVGTTGEVIAAFPDATTIDLHGRFVLPGLHDSHTHILESSLSLSATCLVPTGQVPSAMIETLAECAPHQADIEWVLGYGWDIASVIESGENPLAAIDEAIPDRPAALLEETSHAVWVNTVALERLGIDASTPNPAGGLIVHDADGEPNGLLIDHAGEAAIDAALTQTAAVDEAHDEALQFGLDLLARNGITSFVDARTYWTRGYHGFYDRAEARGELTARAVLSLWASPTMDDETQLAELADLYRRDPTRLVQRTQVKLYVDGLTGNTTARTLTPYVIDYGFETPLGLNYFTPDRLADYLTALEPLGFDFHIHTIGAGAVREALDTIAMTATTRDADAPTPRHRFTHVEHVHPADIERFAALDVIADIQLAGAFAHPETFATAAAYYLGDHDPTLPLPARALTDAGATVTLSSDYIVSPLNPFLGIQGAIDRGPDSLTMAEAIEAYTINAAYLMGHDDLVGSIEVGKRADFVVLDQNPFETPIADIAATTVLLTVFDGNEVYRHERY